MAARSKARKRAVDVLYESDVRGTDPVTTLAERLAQADPGNLALLDDVLGEHSEGWTVDRMPPVDRAVLRLALYELLVREDVPDAVVIDEAVELAKSLSTDESPRFVNGVLGRVLRERPPAVPPPTPIPPAPAAPTPE
jgi:transcription antitermination protein NusB